MMGIKNGARMQRAFALVLAVGLTSTAASADVWVTGSICTEANAASGNVFNYNGGFATNPSAGAVFASCPIPTDQNLGTTHSFEVRVEDNSAQDFLSFIGLVIGTNGEILSSSNSGQAAGTGEITLSFSATTGVGSDDYSYVVLGSVPGSSSQIENLHIF
jgi:hypothetical protein